MTEFISDPIIDLAFNYLGYTGRNVFLTGRAGTGKTTFLKELRKISSKRIVVTAPTGVAAINAGGVTIHSLLQLPFGLFNPESPNLSVINSKKSKLNILRSLELLVIDEVSMVRADLLDEVDYVLRKYRRNERPFGGVQLLLIGDLQQLSPVVKNDELPFLSRFYNSPHFFSARVWEKTSFITIELDKIHRQSDQIFIDILNKIRTKDIDDILLEKLNQRYNPEKKIPKNDNTIILVALNRQADSINKSRLAAINMPEHIFTAEIKGDFPENSYPVEKELRIKIGASVMFVKNDSEIVKRYYNGKIGVVSDIEDSHVVVKCEEEDSEIIVKPETWENTAFVTDENTAEIKEEIRGTFTRIPLRLAWAITVHKSQGLTFGKMILDPQGSFAHGQLYVALSRSKTLEGLQLINPVKRSDIITDSTVETFSNDNSKQTPDSNSLIADKRTYYFDIIDELFDFKILYSDIKILARKHEEAGNSFAGDFTFDFAPSLINEKMLITAQKFSAQIRSLFADNSDNIEDELKSRVEKGCLYFLNVAETFIKPHIDKFAFVCDNKDFKKKIDEAFEKLKQDFIFKTSCLRELEKDFSVSKYLDIKAKLQISDNQTENKPSYFKSGSTVSASKNPELYAVLTKWRKDIAYYKDLEAKEIISNQTLLLISDTNPENFTALKAIKGMSGKAGKEYGKLIFNIVMKFRKENGFDVDEQTIKEAEFLSLDSPSQTLFLLNQDLDIKQIAKQRGLSESTIAQHLIKFVESGEADVKKIVSQQAFKAVNDYLSDNPKAYLKDIYNDLKGKYSYNEIKLIIADYSSNQK